MPMKVSTSSRLIAVAVIGALGGALFHFKSSKTFQMSREAFLAVESARYDRWVTTHPRLLAGVIAGVLAAGVVVGMYELLVLGITRLLGTRNGGGAASR
jgi:hypothetical protein